MSLALQFADQLPPAVRAELEQLIFNLQLQLKPPQEYSLLDLAFSTNGVVGDTWLKTGSSYGTIHLLSASRSRLFMQVDAVGTVTVTTANYASINLPGGFTIAPGIPGAGGLCYLQNGANSGPALWFVKSTNPGVFKTDRVYFRPLAFALATGSLEIIATMIIPVTRS